jgi:hypothetical protein
LSDDFDGTVTIFEQQRSFAVKAELFCEEILWFETMGIETVTHNQGLVGDRENTKAANPRFPDYLLLVSFDTD